MTHPSDLDELVVADKMRSTCSASDVMDNLLVVVGAVVGDTDMAASVPYVDQTSAAAADIDLMVMSCLRELKKVFFIEKLRVMKKCLVNTHKVQAEFDPQADACLSKLTKGCKI